MASDVAASLRTLNDLLAGYVVYRRTSSRAELRLSRDLNPIHKFSEQG